jgi:hypothetical protein
MKRYIIFAVTFCTSIPIFAETEEITVYDYGTGTFSTETVTRENGNVNSLKYDYGTKSFSTYQGDSDGGTGYDYGTGTFTSTDGNPYGVQE